MARQDSLPIPAFRLCRQLGYNMFAFAVDEAALGVESERADYVKELFSAFNQRRRSRFNRLGWGGLFTSPGSEQGFVEIIAGEGEEWDTSILVRRVTTWEAKDQLVPGSRVFVMDRHPDSARILTHDLLFVGNDADSGLAICQDKAGNIVRLRNVQHDDAVVDGANAPRATKLLPDCEPRGRTQPD